MSIAPANHVRTKLESGATLKARQPLHLEIRVAEVSPWPALSILVNVVLPGQRVPLYRLQTAEGHFRHGQIELKADALDALLIRTIRQLPITAEDTYIAGARDFARVLALLRQASPNCEVSEHGRVRRLEILEEPARATLHIARTPGAAAGESALRVVARAGFRAADTGEPLGLPLARDNSYWTFQNGITPPPELPDDALLRGLFDKTPLQIPEFIGIEALDLLCRARMHAKRFSIHVDPAIQALGISFEPLREKITVRRAENGDVELVRELFTPAGKAVPFPADRARVAKAPQEQTETAESEPKEKAWLEVDGMRHRLPEHFSGESLYKLLPAEMPRQTPSRALHRIEGDEIPRFIMDTLPKLKEFGAQIAAELDDFDVCLTLKPSLNVELSDERSSERVRASLYFEPAALFRNTSSREKIAVTPVEILAAAAQGRQYIRQGDTFIRVDRELVAGCRKKLEEGVGVSDADFETEDQQIPKLLAWARKAAHDEHTPWNCYVAESVAGAHHIKDEQAAVRVTLDIDEDEGKDAWFTLNASFDHGGVQLTEEEMRKLADEGREWFNKNGTWIHVDKQALKRFDEKIKQTGVQVIEQDAPLFGYVAPKRRKKFYYRFRPAERERIHDVFSIAGTVEHNERYKRFLDQLMGFENIQALALPASMKLVPWPYQQKGFEWLAFLARYGLNGVLADDMGLGKTAQTIAQLTRMRDEFGFMPSLIITPTSLADNWRSELEKFSPGMRVLIYRGSPSRRDRLRASIAPEDAPLGAAGIDKGYDVVIATLGTVRNDVSLLRKLPWRYVVVDEAHFIKNAAASVAKAVKTIPAKHRLALTGTPIQNRLTELWSLFDFLMPGFLGRQAHFTQQYEEPIMKLQSGRAESEEEHETGKNASERLREKIFPFVLRRLKTDVAQDLPAKIESDIFCPLSPEQTALYKGFGESEEARRAVSDIVEKGDASAPAILAALMALRKICNHPDLMYLPKDGKRQHVREPIPGYETRSGKLEALGELLQQCRDGGHRALIFCQLTSMLDILAHYVVKAGMKYSRIDGETPGMSRQGLVDRFNKDESIGVFLISTRAGGAGLNLTGADTVIFYDHDWNPANDQQAQDRAYRIGQKKTVNVYRLICKGTLEEKILRRQALKKALATSIITHDHSGVKALSREELLSLFTLSE